jgi:hypothetical protein
MVQAENLDHSRSVEHFIPNTLLSVPRSQRDGDFFACRKCNSTKSKIDYILAVVARVQSPNDEVATKTLLKAVTSSKKSSKKFIEMLRGARHRPDGVHMDTPIDGRDLLNYMMYLAKGQYFRETGSIFDEQSLIVQIEFVNKPVLSALKSNYKGQHWSDPILDLIKNPNSESFGKDECVIWTREHDYLFILHHYTAIIIRIRPRSRRNRARARELEWKLLRDFRPKRKS